MSLYIINVDTVQLDIIIASEALNTLLSNDLFTFSPQEFWDAIVEKTRFGHTQSHIFGSAYACGFFLSLMDYVFKGKLLLFAFQCLRNTFMCLWSLKILASGKIQDWRKWGDIQLPNWLMGRDRFYWMPLSPPRTSSIKIILWKASRNDAKRYCSGTQE